MSLKIFTIAQECRFNGKPLKVGDTIRLDPENPKDAADLGMLLGSNRLVENPWSEASAPIKDAAAEDSLAGVVATKKQKPAAK